MRFKATTDQVLLICVNMINASELAPMATMQGATKESSAVTFKTLREWHLQRPSDTWFCFDYFNGRMIKTDIVLAQRCEDGLSEWDIRFGDKLDPEFQSWCKVYPSVQDLLDSINIKAY